MEAAFPFLTEGANAYKWTELAHDLQVEGALQAIARLSGDRLTETVAGPCPRCGDPITHTRIDNAVVLGAGILGDQPLDGETEPEQLTHTINVRCNCDKTQHPGAKPGRPGCGIVFSVSAWVEGS